MTDILHGVRVIELAAWTFVPAAGAVLADWGADVIKVEHPETGDPQRGLINSGLVPGAGGVNHFIEQPNRGKRSFGLNTSSPEGLEVLMKLIETSDVFVTNLLPDSRARMGIDIDQVRARNPKIIYARGHGYGTKGDLAGQGGYDLAAYWARGGIGEAYAAGDGSYPPIQRPAFGDVYGGLSIAAGIVGALFKRERTGEPSVVDVSLLNAAIWQLGPDVVGAGITGEDIPRFQLSEMPNPVASIYKTRDGRHIAFVLLQADRFWADFCTRLGRTDLIDDERFANAMVRFGNRADCITELRRTLGEHDLAHWEKAFEGFDGVWDVMRTAREIHDDPQAIANGYLPRTTDANGNEFALAASPVQFDETPMDLECAPGHGEHTDALLAELGFGEEEIIDLKVKSVVL
ncbi:CaiB/BaiF CoA transferase family protein [Mycobacterium deserti]|uniref:CoA transferase n=1 Tax=Mycobacterium deserti TaxID=2978347 RepID=A0ABT2M4C9_9MYCO|nr:CaiB/BaiF CoA-transferase family protein [Mycobacterium deserti]MCT7657123.1 CoA transferase [Mycobacterium deserti]